MATTRNVGAGAEVLSVMSVRSGARARAGATLLALGLVLSACGSGDDDEAAPITPAPTTASPATTAPSPAPTTSKCTPRNQEPPSGYAALLGDPTDFDGDGRADGLFEQRGKPGELFIAPTSGEGATISFPTAKPYSRMGGIDPDGDGDQEMFFLGAHPVGSVVQVLTVAGCRVAFAVNAEGKPYEFLVTYGGEPSGDGVGCIDATGDGRSDLVGLHYEQRGATVEWARTVVRIDGGKAVNGPVDRGTYSSPADDERIRLLSQATCGRRTTFTE